MVWQQLEKRMARSSFPSSYDAYKGLQKKMAKWDKKRKKPDASSSYELEQIRKAKTSRVSEKGARSFQQKTIHKRHLVDDTGNNRDGNVLHNLELAGPIVSGFGIDNRERQSIYVKGVKLAMYFRNLQEDKTLNLRWALVYEKGGGGAPLNIDFYVGTGGSKTVDFDSVASGLHHITYPINRQKWKVLAEGKKTLAPGRTSTSSSPFYSGDVTNDVMIETYVPVGEVVNYDSGTVGTEQQEIYLLYWVVDPTYNNVAPQTANHYSRRHTILYFTDPT